MSIQLTIKNAVDSLGTVRESGADVAKLSGKTALITGGSQGIGLAIAQAFIEEGGQVVITGRSQSALDQAVTQLGAEKVLACAGDVRDREHARSTVAASMERFGRIDILVNNAALERSSGPAITTSLDEFEETFAVNLFAPLNWTQLVWKASMQAHGGNVLMISSLGSITLYANMGAYQASKAALNHLTRTLAAEVGPGVRVNAILPGLIKTEMSRKAWEPNEEKFSRNLPMERLGEPEDVAKAAVFLASDDSSWITGESLVIDGGTIIQWGRLRKKPRAS
jgi:NAD(P)-dependent dehydrogenase (short-subunit alcohol dehydrogenase family)